VFAGRRNGAKLEPLVKEIEKAAAKFTRARSTPQGEEIISFLGTPTSTRRSRSASSNIGANVNFPILDTTERVFRKSGKWPAIPAFRRA